MCAHRPASGLREAFALQTCALRGSRVAHGTIFTTTCEAVGPLVAFASRVADASWKVPTPLTSSTTAQEFRHGIHQSACVNLECADARSWAWEWLCSMCQLATCMVPARQLRLPAPTSCSSKDGQQNHHMHTCGMEPGLIMNPLLSSNACSDTSHD